MACYRPPLLHVCLDFAVQPNHANAAMPSHPRRREVRTPRWWRVATSGFALLVLAACAEPGDDGVREVAAELRALRLSLRDARNLAPPPAAAAPDRAGLSQALQPMQELVDQLARQQQQLGTQQAALVGELQRWTAVVGPALAAGSSQAGEAARAELTAMAARLQQLEAALAAQEVRHREVETLLGKTLDRTADRLEEFLRRVAPPAGGAGAAAPAGAGGGTNEPAGSSPGNAEASGAAAPPGQTETRPAAGSAVPEPGVRVGAAATPRGFWQRAKPGELAAWLGALLVALAAGAGFAFRLRRSPVVEVAGPDAAVADLLAVAPLLGPAAACPLAESPAAGASASAVVAEEVEAPAVAADVLPVAEVGAAPAAASSAGVGVAEQLAVAGAAPQAAEEAVTESQAADDDVFVIEELGDEPSPASAVAAPGTRSAASVAAATDEAPSAEAQRFEWLLPCRDAAAAVARLEAFWRSEPGRLAAAPEVVWVGTGCLLVACRPKLGLAARELAALEVAVRAAARG